MFIQPLTRLVCSAILLTIIASVQAQDAASIAYDDPFTGFKFPRNLGSFTFQNHQRYNHVDLGYGINYVDRSGATATIIVYDLNLRGFSNGTSAPEVLEEYRKIDESIQSVVQQGGYRGASRIETARLSKGWLQMSHELVRPDARMAYTHSFIRAQNGRFVKVRVTANSEASLQRLPIFLLAVSRAIGMLDS